MLGAMEQVRYSDEQVAYLRGLYTLAIGGNPEACEVLSLVAMGCPGLPRVLCEQMDRVLNIENRGWYDEY